MKHPITAEDWTGYLDGELRAEDAERVASHLKVCPKCRRLREELRDAETVLVELGRAAQLSGDVGPEVIRRAKLLFFQRARDVEDSAEVPVRESVLRLHDLLAPMCGSRTAHLMMNTAALRTDGLPLDGMTAKRWPTFVANVVHFLKPLCGRPAAQLVLEASRI
jgi:anti-sigma factor RsiW